MKLTILRWRFINKSNEGTWQILVSPVYQKHGSLLVEGMRIESLTCPVM